MVKIRLMTVNDWKGVEQVWKDHEGTNPVDDIVIICCMSSVLYFLICITFNPQFLTLS